MVGDLSKVGRNEPCPCGSGKKYKKCCGNESGEPVAEENKDGSVGKATITKFPVRPIHSRA
jgi:hypothetical protein